MDQDQFYLTKNQSMMADSGVYYKYVQDLGQGGNANTYLTVATSGPHKGVLFAIKVFRKVSNRNRRDAFLKEIEYLKNTSHPSIMRVYDAGIFSARGMEYPFVAAEYLPRTLRGIMKAKSASMPEKVSYALQLLSAISYLAESSPSVVHRDIKPENIFVKGGSCVLGDFGLMKLATTTEANDRDILKESELPGMPFFYRTPDLVSYAHKERGITPKSDVFQLGLVLAELFTGTNPLKYTDDILAPVELKPLDTVPGNFGNRVSPLINRMLKLDPNTREAAADLMDGWLGLFQNITEASHNLEGSVFR